MFVTSMILHVWPSLPSRSASRLRAERPWNRECLAEQAFDWMVLSAPQFLKIHESMELKMTASRRFLSMGILAALSAAMMTMAGCATQEPTSPASVEQKIENAIKPVDHEDLASRYDLQATQNADASKRHLGYAAIYRKNTSPRSGPDAHLALAKHCENLALVYQKAADESTAMARLHRELATQSSSP